jgi:asparagine synthase (glutamine-hydrolysing)
MYLMSRKIKASGVKMVLSGEGSDEMFGGYLYFHKAPNPEEFHKELIRKLRALYMYDCLRANKATLAWGVEARVPFLDREFLELVMSMNPEQKMCVDEQGNPRIEKHVLRDAFDVSKDDSDTEPPSKRLKLYSGDYVGKPYLPEEVLWRQKEQFSDGVGYNWIDTLRSIAADKVTDEQLEQAAFRFPYNTPTTKEGYYYRSIFVQHFPSDCAAKTVPGGPSVACSTAAAIEWDASFKNRADPSGRAVTGVHTDAIDSNVKLS